MKFWRYEFEDGYYCYASTFTRLEMQVEVRKHGKLVSKTPA